MKATAIFHLASVGGPARSVRPVLESLAGRGELEVLVPGDGPVAHEYAPIARVRRGQYWPLTHVSGPTARVALARRVGREVRGFRAELQRRRPDLVIVVTTVLPSGLVAAQLEGIPAIVYAAEIFNQPWKDSPTRRRGGALLAAATGQLAAGIVSCSPAVAAQFPARAGQAVAVASPPIIPTEYAGGDRDRGRRRLGIAPEDHCIAVVGALSRGRGQDVAIRALDGIRGRLPDARLLVVGAPHPLAVDLAYATELRGLTARLGLTGAVVFAGETDAMADVYAAADVVVNPARFEEPFGRVAAEALAAGVPVVSTRVGAVEATLRDRVDALLIPPDDPAALTEAVVRLREEPSTAAALVAHGRERVTTTFTVERTMREWAPVIESALEANGRAHAS
jgi:glycosyltransferase involved in cell wall biosynthesis